MNLREVLRIYDSVKHHLPVSNQELNPVEYLSTIVSSIRTNGKDGDFSRFALLCLNKDTLEGVTSDEIIVAMYKTLTDMHIDTLHKVLKEIGYG